MLLQVSPQGRALIERFEGCKLLAYLCPAGVWTIGYGHTLGVRKGQRITAAQADAMLAADLAIFAKAVNDNIKLQLQQHEFDACVSLAFNIGAAAFAQSSVARRLNDEDFSGAASAFLMWTHVKGKVSPGLVTRRAAEVAEFNLDHPLAKRLAAAVVRPMPQRVDLPPLELHPLAA